MLPISKAKTIQNKHARECKVKPAFCPDVTKKQNTQKLPTTN